MRISDWSSDVCSSDLAPEDGAVSQVNYSIAGRVANGLNLVLAPIGFNRDISLALIPAMAAREVAVSALATVYSLDADEDEARLERSLGDRLKDNRSEEHTSELQSLMRTSYAVFCLKKNTKTKHK